MRSFWPVFFMHLTTYGCFASVIGLWGGPWLSDVHGADLGTRGRILLLGATAQICGMLLWGAMDRFWRSYKKPVLIGSTATILLLVILVIVPFDRTSATVWFAAVRSQRRLHADPHQPWQVAVPGGAHGARASRS